MKYCVNCIYKEEATSIYDFYQKTLTMPNMKFWGLKDFAYNALQFICNFGIGILYIILIGVPSVLLVALLYWLCFGKIGLVKKLFRKLK
jgi:phosphatidylserine synthase